MATFYDVKFIAPEDFDAGRVYKIDGETVTLKDLHGEALDDAWKQGAVVTLSRNGSDAYFNKGGGKGISLNVIKADTINDLPLTGTDYQLCVITTTAITGVFADVVAPLVRSDGSPLSGGEVWFDTTSESGVISHRVFKKPNLSLSIRRVFQYIGGAWVGKIGFAWDGEWGPLGKAVFSAKRGINLLGTSWNSYNGVDGSAYNSISASFAPGIKITKTSQTHFSNSMPTATTTNITLYNTFLVNIKRAPATGSKYVRGTVNNSSKVPLIRTPTKTNPATGYVSADITAFTGNCYLGIEGGTADTGDYIEVSEMYLC